MVILRAIELTDGLSDSWKYQGKWLFEIDVSGERLLTLQPALHSLKSSFGLVAVICTEMSRSPAHPSYHDLDEEAIFEKIWSIYSYAYLLFRGQQF